jgi:tetratricopeptide (TPR) repeat protein
MKILITVCVLVLAVLSPYGLAIDNETLWNQAAENYDNGAYQSAIDNYSRLIEKGYINAEIFHNLGNSYFKSGQYGRAIWAYRRALAIDSDLEQARTNLQFAREMNIDKIEVARGGFIFDIWDFLTGLLGYNGYLLLFTIIWWFSGTLLLIIIYRGRFASWPYYLLLAGLILAIFSATAAARRIKIDRLTSWGVLVENAADINEGPGEDFERIEIGHEGLEFKILGEREDSYLIELENGLKGWIDKDAVLKI